MIWCIITPTKIIIGTREIHLSKAPLFCRFDIINGFSLKDDNHYNEFQSDSNTTNDNTAKVTNSNLKTIIDNKLAELNLSGYSAKMIMNRAEAMSCSGCHQNSSDEAPHAVIDPSVLRAAKAPPLG
jgi:hypothetical protein